MALSPRLISLAVFTFGPCRTTEYLARVKSSWLPLALRTSLPDRGFMLTISPLTVMAFAVDLAPRAPGAHGLAAHGFFAEHGFFAAQGLAAHGFFAAHGLD
ncbi:MAG: hypothetical protein V3U06_10015 [Candidatus Binatia bacterium]